jgi:hypothetical protein
MTINPEGPTLSVKSIVTIASGFAARTDPDALVVGPTGLAWDPDTDELFVADTGNNRIQRLSGVSTMCGDQGAGETVFAGAPLAGPLGLLLLPNGNILTVNGDAVDSGTPPNTAVEISREGTIVSTRQLDTSGVAGALFGIALTTFNDAPALVWVNDNDASVNVSATALSEEVKKDDSSDDMKAASDDDMEKVDTGDDN